MSGELEKFYAEKKQRIKEQGQNTELKKAGLEFMRQSIKSGYSYNYSWLGRPIIQYPEDLLAMQEIIWKVKPKLIVETGVAHGGTSIFYASMLELIGDDGLVLAIDIDIRAHNRPLIEGHPQAGRLRLMEASSLDGRAVDEAKTMAAKGGPVMVVLDSNHSHEHVLEELRLYSPLVTKDSYLVVFDGVVELVPELWQPADRPWGVGNNPLTATRAFLAEHPEFAVDWEIENKLIITTAPEGYLKRIA